ncbi:MAG: hypothetical protein IH595_13275 [Bacteroidales bacterium]|nr:hypothetical protein [Bacteroidales bacterium]
MFISTSAFATNNVYLFTPYTTISVPPGKSINYIITVVNNTSEVQNLGVSISGMPWGWKYNMKSGGWDIKKIAVLPKQKEIINLHVEVPLKINKGTYHFNVVAGANHLPLSVIVSKRGTYKTTFTATQANMEGHNNSTFSFNANLDNLTADQQLYSLRSEAPLGWDVTFMSHYKNVTSVSVDPNNDAPITVKVTPPDGITAGTYKIPVSAVTNNTSADLQLEVVITGTYDMVLSTPTGLVSTEITAGKQRRLELIVRNTGSAILYDVQPGYQAPANWKVTFDPKSISEIQPGQYAKIFATIKSDKNAIAGDYITKITTKTPEVASSVSFRVSVQTPLLWGWVGVLIILFAFGLVYYLFRKYGRR